MAPAENLPADFPDRVRATLREEWAQVLRSGEAGTLADCVADEGARGDIRALINSKVKTYRYVLPTQLGAKVVDGTLDCRCLQARRGGRGAFDARTVAHKVIVPFDQENSRVLGGSQEPYVNNPLRVPEVSPKHRAAQKNHKDWDALCRVLDRVQAEANPDFARAMFRQTLVEIYRRLQESAVKYAVPRRASLQAILSLVSEYLTVPSGGDRLLAMTAALFVMIGKRFRLWAEVRRRNITAADASSGMLADLECVAEDERVALVVEAKDCELTITHMRGKTQELRERQVTELLFVAQGARADDKAAIREAVDREFAAGHNVYVTDLGRLAEVCLSLAGEESRREFLCEVGRQLEQYRSELVHRRAWAATLERL